MDVKKLKFLLDQVSLEANLASTANVLFEITCELFEEGVPLGKYEPEGISGFMMVLTEFVARMNDLRQKATEAKEVFGLDEDERELLQARMQHMSSEVGRAEACLLRCHTILNITKLGNPLSAFTLKR